MQGVSATRSGSHSFESFQDEAVDPPIRGFLHSPEESNGDGIVLVHGAGSSVQAPLLIALAQALGAAGFTALRCDLPYRQLRPHGPPRPGDAARDRAGLKNAVAAMRQLAAGRVFLGGHSYGGRQSTMLAAAEPDLVAGLLLLSYPLHPPRKPDQPRTQHLPNLRSPSLFVHGTRDPFGSMEEVRKALQLIPVDTRLLAVEGAGHDLNFKRGQAGGELIEKVVVTFQAFLGKENRSRTLDLVDPA